MSYQANPTADANIRNRLRQILDEKIKDRTYKGESFVGGIRYRTSAQVKRDRAARKVYRRSKRKMDRYMPIRSESSQMMGGVRKKAGKSAKKVRAGKRGARENPWIQFYRRWVNKNRSTTRGMSGKELAKMAAQEYRRAGR